MAYSQGSLPLERASKIAHMHLVKDQTLTEILQSFESDTDPHSHFTVEKTGTVDLSTSPAVVDKVLTVDGGLAVIPNPLQRRKALAFIQVGSCLLNMKDLLRIRDDPMLDPRIYRELVQKVQYRPAALPLAGVRAPHCTVKESIRRTINSALSRPWLDLYWVLEFLLFRDWLPDDAARDIPSFDCYKCRSSIQVPRKQLFRCESCGHEHFLSDYLQIGFDNPDTWSRQDSAMALMSVIETLALFEVPAYMVVHGKAAQLERALFVKDGPLLLRAALSRLVEPIREFIQWMRENGHMLRIVGVEKTGDFVSYLDEFSAPLKDPGDYFIPTTRFMVEEVAGSHFDERTYRNRVSYGNKVAVRLSPNHVVPLSVPTGGTYRTEPTSEDLYGFDDVVRTLATLTSAKHDNALIPLVLANNAVSISERPSGGILNEFADALMQ